MAKRSFPAGVYTAQAVKSWLTGKGVCRSVYWQFEILDGPHKGKRFNVGAIISHTNKRLEARGREQCALLVAAVDVSEITDTEQLHRKACLVYLYAFKPRWSVTASAWACERIDAPGVKSGEVSRYVA